MNRSDPDVAASVPGIIVLDTNVFMRLLIVDYATEAHFFKSSRQLRATVVLFPTQPDEIWRNLPTVFDQHKKSWSELCKRTRGAVQEVRQDLHSLRVLGICDEELAKSAGVLQAKTDKLKERAFEPVEFYNFVETILSRCLDAWKVLTDRERGDRDHLRLRAEETLLERANTRAAAQNPPFAKDKTRHLGDCLLWETCLALLRYRASDNVWFATMDNDFLHEGELHPFLSREVQLALRWKQPTQVNDRSSERRFRLFVDRGCAPRGNLTALSARSGRGSHLLRLPPPPVGPTRAATGGDGCRSAGE